MPSFAAPRFATRRNPDLPTDGPAVARVGRALGTPLLGWQRLVADVACERTPDGRYRYPIVVLTVPRQSGKTVLLRCVGVHRASVRPGSAIFYTAQTGKDARRRWEDMVEAVENSPLGRVVTKSLRAGQEAMIFPNRSRFGVFAPKRDALHGETPPLVLLDEAWKHDPELGEALMGAIRPAQITLPASQLWIVSTAGDEESTWFRAWVEAGRAAVADPGAAIAHFEWSAPDDAPRDDPAVWSRYHPTYGALVTEDDLRENLTLDDFDRAFLNRWPSSAQLAVVPMPSFDALADLAQADPDPGTVTLGFEVGAHRRDAAIAAAWRDGNGVSRVKLIEHAGGASWLMPRLRELAERWRPRAITYDDHGESAAVAAELDIDGHDLIPVTGRDYATACGAMLGAIVDGRMVHDGAPPLRAAAEDARRRKVGDVWVWERMNPDPEAASPSPLIAATVARWTDEHADIPEPMPRPEVIVLS